MDIKRIKEFFNGVVPTLNVSNQLNLPNSYDEVYVPVKYSFNQTYDEVESKTKILIENKIPFILSVSVYSVSTFIFLYDGDHFIEHCEFTFLEGEEWKSTDEYKLLSQISNVDSEKIKLYNLLVSI